MNGQQLIKWGLGLWVVYKILKEINSNSQSLTNNVNPGNSTPRSLAEYNTIHHGSQPPQPSQNSPTNPDVRRIIEESFRAAYDTVFKKPTLLEPQTTKPSPDPQTIEAERWLKLIRHPSIVVILGGRGKGKSALGYRLLEHLRWTASVYVIGLPKSARKLLPDYIGMATSLEDVSPNSIVLVDEGYLTYHARRSMAATSVQMSQILNLSRQRNQTLIFVTQEAGQIDRNVTSSANVVIFKDLGMLQLEFDRRQLNNIATKAKEAFATAPSDKRKWAYVYSPDSDFMGLVENSLPTFWKEKLSHIFTTGGKVVARGPKKTPLTERIERAKELSQQGLSLGKIAKLMGVTKPTIKNYLEGYPYKA